MNILEGLNPQQKEAVQKTEGALLVIAGAGSGKTKVLTSRIAYLIKEKNVAPWNILAITFTNRATKEMKERLEKMLGPVDAENTWVSTFHSMCVRILRRSIEKIGYTKQFTIYDSDDSKKLIRSIMKQINLDEKSIKPKAIQNYISSMKNDFISPNESKNEADNFIAKKMAEVYALYEDELKKNNALDFDDLLVKTLQLLNYDQETREFYQEKFKYILVDEYQDTNKVQYLLVKLLGDKYKNVFVVGDDDQSIYGWRGADIKNILNFEKDYKDASLIRLEQNYRSTNNILELANEVIKNNVQRKKKELWSENGKGDICKLYKASNERDEARFVVSKIKKMHDEDGMSYKDFAIMYRTNAQSRVLEEEITKNMIPYQVYGSVRFYDRREVKDLMAYLSVITNPRDNINCERIINVPKRKIGDTSIEKLTEYAANTGMSLYEVCSEIKNIPELVSLVPKITPFTTIVEELKLLNKENKLQELVETLIDKINFYDYLYDISETEEEAEERKENVGELISKIAYFCEVNGEEANLEKFLSEVMLMSDSDGMESEDERVKLMTIHIAKGLEFNTVFLTGLEDGLFPSIGWLEDPEENEFEEERRLLYVGITRAKQNLFVSYAQQRTRFGKTDGCVPSRFLKEFPTDLYEIVFSKQANSSGVRTGQIDDEESSHIGRVGSIITPKLETTISNGKFPFNEGDKIEHKKFGVGTIKTISTLTGGDKAMEVEFEEGQTKKLICSSIVLSLIKKV